jgi:hypothetical protein
MRELAQTAAIIAAWPIASITYEPMYWEAALRCGALGSRWRN